MRWFQRKKPIPPVEDVHIPRHVGIIMDGNGRWAKKRGLPRQAGHVTGAQVFRKITKYCEKKGVGYLTVYAFSTENWRRPAEEVDAKLKGIMENIFHSAYDASKEYGVEGNLVAGANIAGFLKVAEAMKAQGIAY